MRKVQVTLLGLAAVLSMVIAVEQMIIAKQDARLKLPAPTESKCAIIHQPKAGCPDGFAREATPRFTEEDGSKQFACVADQNTKREQCTDYIMPGEREELEIPLIIVKPFENTGSPKI